MLIMQNLIKYVLNINGNFACSKISGSNIDYCHQCRFRPKDSCISSTADKRPGTKHSKGSPNIATGYFHLLNLFGNNQNIADNLVFSTNQIQNKFFTASVAGLQCFCYRKIKDAKRSTVKNSIQEEESFATCCRQAGPFRYCTVQRLYPSVTSVCQWERSYSLLRTIGTGQVFFYF